MQKTNYLVFTLITALLVFFTACNGEDTFDEDLPLDDQVNMLIDADDYETALTLLEDEDRSDPDIQLLLEKTHLNYGLHNMNTFDADEMRTRMNKALVQFTEVLHINPENTIAREQIEQILAVYDTIPNREPDEEVMEGLREVGFDY